MRIAKFVPAFFGLAFCFAPSARAAVTGAKIAAPIGVIVFTDGAQVSQISAQVGASLFIGDTLTTDSSGSMRIRFGESQLVLGPGTVVKLASATEGVAAVLQHGLVRFSASGSALELRVLDAIIHPHDGAAGEVVIVGLREFQIASTKGEIAVIIDGSERLVTESAAYDVTLDAPPALPQGKPIHKRKILWVPITMVAFLTAVGIYETSLSRSKF